MRQPVRTRVPAKTLPALALAASLLACCAPSLAQLAGGPTIVFMYPAGGQRGQTIEATVVGQFLAGATGVLVSGADVKAGILPEDPSAPKPKPNRRGPTPDTPRPWNNTQTTKDRIRVSIEIGPNAQLGQRDLRLVTPGGVSRRCRFFVGDLPELVLPKANGDEASAIEIDALPRVVNGQVFSGWSGPFQLGKPDRNYFRFTAKAGQKLVCHLRGQAIIPFINQAVPGFFDPCLTLYHAGGRVAYADDFTFHPDPVLFYDVKKDGQYVLEIRDTIWRSMEDFIYRLRIGELPYLTHLFPLGGQRGQEVKVELHGVNLPKDSLSLRFGPGDPEVAQVSVVRDGVASNCLPFAVGDLPEQLEAEPNNTPAKANRLKLPVTVNGRIGENGDEDCFVFHADAGQRLEMAVDARRLESPLDSALTLLDSDGKLLAENDDYGLSQAFPPIVQRNNSRSVDPREALITHRADSRLVHEFAKAGDYTLVLRDIRDLGGPDHAYRLTVRPARPDFVLRVETDTVRVCPGDSAALTVSALRSDGFDAAIDLQVKDLPEGFLAAGATLPAGAESARMTITAPAGAAPGLYYPLIEGVGQAEGSKPTRRAVPCESVLQAFYITHLIPTQAWVLEVIPPEFFTLATDLEPGKVLEVAQGGTVDVAVKASRLKGGEAVINVTAESPLRDITAKPAKIAPKTDDAKLTISISKRCPLGRYNVLLTGKMRAGKENVERLAPAVSLNVVKPKK